jgi:hypothetical protein
MTNNFEPCEQAAEDEGMRDLHRPERRRSRKAGRSLSQAERTGLLFDTPAAIISLLTQEDAIARRLAKQH